MSFITESKNAYKKVREALEKETSDHEISMARGELETIADRALATSAMLEGTPEDGNPLPAWVQSKITNACDYITTVHDYLKYSPKLNESIDLTETTFEKIYQMQQDGKTADDIAKELKLNPALVKKVLGEQTELKEFNDAQIALLKKEFDPLKGKQISTARANQLSNILNKLDDGSLQKLKDALIPFVSAVAASKITQRKFKGVKITNVKVPGLENMAEAVDPSKATKLKMISIKGDQKEITIDKKDLEKYLKLDYVIKEYLPEENEITEANEEKISDQAKKQGLEYYGFGRYGKDKIVTHKSVNGKLQTLPKDQQTKADDKGSKPESKPEKVDMVKDLKNTAAEVGFDDLNIEDDGKNISFVKEFDPTIQDEDDVKDEYNNIVKMLNKKGINYKPNFDQDVEIDSDEEYMQINFSVKKEEIKLTEDSLEDLYKKLGWNLNSKTYGATLTHPKHGVIEIDRYGEWHHKPKNISSISTAAYKPLAFGKNNDLSKYISSLKEEVELKPVPSLEDSAKKHNVDIEVLKKQLEKGIEIEKEHTKDEKVAEKIALAHIDERPDYYIQIDKLEKKPVEKVEEACWTGYKQVGLKKKGKKMVPNCVPEETIREQKRLYIESIAAVKNKADKSGMPYSILKQVYDRGMAAWKGGHRPGATQVQWALARVNSFVTKSSGTWGGADSDLAKKVKGKE